MKISDCRRCYRRRGAIAASAASLLLGAVAVTATVRPAYAQEVQEKPFALKVGTFLPTNRYARRASSNALFAIEAQYTLQNLTYGSRYTSKTLLSAAFAGRKDFSIAPITISQIFSTGAAAASGRGAYLGVGAGFYITRLEVSDLSEDPGDAPGGSRTTSGNTKYLLGGFLVGGLNIGNGFVEAKYHIVNTYERKRVDGLQLTAGTRF